MKGLLSTTLFACLIGLPSLLIAEDQACLVCHADGRGNAPAVAPDIINKSIHAGLACTDCHNIDPKTVHRGVREVMCGTCHAKAAEDYARSPHVEGRTVSIEDIPTCSTCHGSHGILANDDPDSRTSHRNSVKVCIQCHEDASIQSKFDVLPGTEMIKAYENSVHGKALLEQGIEEAPACVDCHGSHSFLPSDKPESPIYKTQIASTCGKCHADIESIYSESVHGTALAEGIMESPTCTDCHGEHSIRAHLDPESKVYYTNVAKTCSDCHASEKIVAKFGLKADRIKTFKDSFHGIATEFGETIAANCASCHGVHGIFRQSDPRSMIHEDRIEETCGQCHDDLPASFAKGQVHISASDRESGGPWYVRQFYIWFISLLILAFLVYRLLEYKRRVKRVE